MTIQLSKDAQAIIDQAVASGQYASPEAVIDAGLALLAERQTKLAWLRNKVRSSMAQGGSHTDDEVGEYLDTMLDEAERKQAAK